MNFSHALITGASSGIGEALAHRLSKVIPLITICGRDQERLEQVPGTTRLLADLATAVGRAHVVAALHRTKPDLVINCAGIGRYGPALGTEVAEQLHILEVNGIALAELTLEAARMIQATNKRGVILNVSSVAAFVPLPFSSFYGASKAFVTTLSRNLDLELRPHVRVLAACPGVVVTPFRQRAAGGHPQPKRRWGMSAEEAAKQIVTQIGKRQPIRVFGWGARCQRLIARLLPDRVIGRLVRNQIQKRYLK